MEDNLPTEFDVIVVGTGFPESCVAAACSRIGKKVLHIDPNEYYGGAWASFGLEALNALLDGKEQSPERQNEEIQNGSYKWHLPTTGNGNEDEIIPDENQDQQDTWTIEKIMKQSRRFNLDLCPRILYSTGELVQLLISSNICRYAEFRAIDNVCTVFENKVLAVPCSRSDIFNTKDLNMVEKRLLMKFFTSCMTFNEDPNSSPGQASPTALNQRPIDDNTLLEMYNDKTFSEYINSQQLTDKIKQCLMQAIAMVTRDTTFEEGMHQTRKFLQSLGRYSNTPFIFPMYGCGEIPQCFCRLSAVFGGVYCLKRAITDIRWSGETGSQPPSQQGISIEVEGQKITAQYLIVSPGNIPSSLRSTKVSLQTTLSRAIFITTASITNQLETMEQRSGGGVTILRLLSPDGHREAMIIQLAHQSGTCPQNLFILHLTTSALSNDPAADLEPFVEFLQKMDLALVYSAYFSICGYKLEELNYSNVYATESPIYELDHDHSIQNAKKIFQTIFKDVEFLPRAPDPEENLIDSEYLMQQDEDESAGAENTEQ